MTMRRKRAAAGGRSEFLLKGVAGVIVTVYGDLDPVTENYFHIKTWWNTDPHSVYINEATRTVRFSVNSGDTWQTARLSECGLVFNCDKCPIEVGLAEREHR